MADVATAGYKELEARAERGTGITGIDTGFSELNRMTGGFRKQNLIIIAGRPGLGKTSLCLNIAVHAALRNKKHIGIVSLEMSSQEVYERMACAEAWIDVFRLGHGNLSNLDWNRLTATTGLLHDSPIWVDDSSGNSIVQIRAKAHRLHLQHSLDLLIVDYLGLIAGSQKRYNSKTEEVTEISRGLKLLAKDLDIPVLAACQLNREVEHQRGGGEPQLHHLRESGSIEQDADMVLMLSRDEEKEPGLATLHVRKQRKGPTGDVRLKWMKQWTLFGSLDEIHAEEDRTYPRAVDDER